MREEIFFLTNGRLDAIFLYYKAAGADACAGNRKKAGKERVRSGSFYRESCRRYGGLAESGRRRSAGKWFWSCAAEAVRGRGICRDAKEGLFGGKEKYGSFLCRIFPVV